MKKRILILLGCVGLTLGLVRLVFSAENPDGPPGMVAIEPGFSYWTSSGDKYQAMGQSVENTSDANETGAFVSLLVPATNRLTLRGTISYAKMSAETPIEGITLKETRNNFAVVVSARFWVGSRKDKR